MLAETCTHTVQPYTYGTEKHTIRVWYIPYAYGIYVPYAYGMKYAYGTQQNNIMVHGMNRSKECTLIAARYSRACMERSGFQMQRLAGCMQLIKQAQLHAYRRDRAKNPCSTSQPSYSYSFICRSLMG